MSRATGGESRTGGGPPATGDASRATGARRVTLRCSFCGKLNRVDLARAVQRPRCGSCGRPFLLDRPVKVAGEDLAGLVREAEAPVLVDFYAEWCAPCRIMAPRLDDFARRHAGEVLVAKLDTDLGPEVSRAHGIRSIPTLLLFRDGAEAGREVGAVPVERLEALLARAS